MATAVVFFVGEDYMGSPRHPEGVKEKVLAELAMGVPLTQLSKKYNLATSTMQTWKVKAQTESDEFAKQRNENKKNFLDKAWKLINDSVDVAQKRVGRSKDLEDNIDIVAKAIKDNAEGIAKDTGLGYFDLVNLVKELHAMKSPKISELSTLIGTMYDKQALASDEATENVKVKLEDFF